MAKRTRGTQRTPHRRPGTRPSTSRSGTSPLRAPSQLAAAADIAEDMAGDRPAAATEELERVSRSTPARVRTRPGGMLAAKAAAEYLYVAQDIRRIVLVSVLLFAVMFALWLLIVVLRVVQI